jgi:hypothetical protein
MDYPLIGTKTKAENAEAKKELKETALGLLCFGGLVGVILVVIWLLPQSETQKRTLAERAFAEAMMRKDPTVKSLAGWINWVEVKRGSDGSFGRRSHYKPMHERKEANERVDGRVWFKVEADDGFGWIIVDYWWDYKTGENGVSKIDHNTSFFSSKR